ncbi:MAG: IPT/TIG domain-containing protein, partial [Planctomycetota bacterium]
ITDRNHQLRCGLENEKLTIGQPILPEPVPLGNPESGNVDEAEPNDSFRDAQWVEAPCTIRGTMNPMQGGEIVDGGDIIEDVYRLDVVRAGWMVFEVQALSRTSTDLDIVVFDDEFVACRPEGGASPSSDERFSAELRPGTYFVMVTSYDGVRSASEVDYDLRIERLNPFPTGVGDLEFRSAGSDSVLLEWIIAEDIEGVSIALERRLANENRFQPIAALSRSNNVYEDATLPPGSDVVYRVRVQNPGGDVGYTDDLVVASSIRIDSVTPNEGSASGGTVVSIRGVNFTKNARFQIGGEPLEKFEWVSSNEVRGVTAPSSPGRVHVVVTTDTDSAFLRGGFTYLESTEPQFRRGEVNADRVTNLTDALLILDHLFIGQARLECLKAADFDDNGRVEIADPIGSLSYQFLGGPPPPAPGLEDCGEDPTEDQLSCERYSACN